ncbi:hypothetical protein [Oceanobacillus neutriphilus]|uniref:Uncharacterized protein n=1 Tax=Oceanobacillus neutriphilus TaxID=531815 RepID=A0ABQ2NRC7_9BACI|nr:hypothetical protein [Oceanobacillus neutriphilus]GGP08732.1 hypothetical protein GCM10011346_09990 [Oceanobacillus neutriphilus]
MSALDIKYMNELFRIEEGIDKNIETARILNNLEYVLLVILLEFSFIH